MPKLEKLMDQYRIKNRDVCRRWATNSDLAIEDIVQDVARVERMKFNKSELVESGQITGSGEEHDVDFLRMFEDEIGSKSSKEDASKQFIKEVGKA